MKPERSQSTLASPKRRGGADGRAWALTIAFHPDLGRVGEVALIDGEVELSRDAPRFASPGGRADPVALQDRHISRRPIRLSVARDEVALDARPEGSDVVVDGERVRGTHKLALKALDRGVVLELADRVVLLLHSCRALAPDKPAALGLVGENEAIDELRRHILRVADLPVPVLIRGETGTGKELVARAVHAASARARRPFVGINMAAIPAGTAAGELFGYNRGAFTGAVADHVGYFGQASGGSLFLDEIGATPHEVQPMLLRALESHEIQPLGSPTRRTVDTRLIAATDADLERAITDESFRAALLHRLEGYQLFVPPLRERRDDIGRLLVHFLRFELGAIGELHKLDAPADGAPTWLPAAFAARLVRLDWPGNVRQLKNAVRQFVISSRGGDGLVVDAAMLRLLDAAEGPGRSAPPPVPPGDDRRGPREIDDDELVEALRACDWLANRAAARLGVSRSYLYERIKASPRIRKASELPAAEIVACRDACAGDLDEVARRLGVSRRSLILRMRELGL